jgi:hypothetical protein
MLEANPALEPNQIKTILLMTAVKMTQPHVLEQGNGMLNAYTAVQTAAGLDVLNQVMTVNVDPGWTLQAEQGAEEIQAGGAFVAGDRVVYTSLADPKGRLWGDGVIWSDSALWTDSALWADSLFYPNSVVWSDSALWADSIVWSDSALWSDSAVWADSIVWSDSALWSDSAIWADSIVWSDSAIWADCTGD